MDKFTMVILTSGISIVIALISLLGVLISSRNAKQASLEVERLKRKHQLQDNKKKLFDEQSILAIDGIKASMEAIQNSKR